MGRFFPSLLRRLRFKFILLVVGMATIPLFVVMSITTAYLVTVERQNAFFLNRQL